MKTIPVSNGKFVAIVDDEDFDKVSQFSWHIHHEGYARTESNQTNMYMHRLIISAPEGKQIDHANGHPLDNRRCNLRVATAEENQQNQRKTNRPTSSKYKGVSLHKNFGKWEAYIRVNRKRIYLGLFVSEEDAAHAYDRAAKEHFGRFARPNFTSQAI